MITAPNVTVVPATITLQQGLNRSLLEHLLRVVGYARVSTDDPEQLSSYEAQVDYYSCGDYTIDRDGLVTGPDSLNLLVGLAERGHEPEPDRTFYLITPRGTLRTGFDQ